MRSRSSSSSSSSSRREVMWSKRAVAWGVACCAAVSSQEMPIVLPPATPLPGPSRGAFVLHHHESRLSELYTHHHEARLSEMRARAELLRESLYNATVHDNRRTALGIRLHEYLRRKLIDDGKDYEISVCRPHGVAFIHVYKAAGTTGKFFMEAACPEKRHHFSCCGCDDEPNPVFCHKIDEGDQWSRNVTTTFAIVRDPVERFQSGIFELALRGDPWITEHVERAQRENITVAEAAIDDLLSRKPWFMPDPHIMEQTFFLVDRRRPPTALNYIAKVGPDLADDFAALGHRLFGKPRTTFDQLGRHRDAHDLAYGKDKIYIHDQPLGPATVAKIKQYYQFDYLWLDPKTPRHPHRRPRLFKG